MTIEKNTYDKDYPFTICDSWGNRLPVGFEELKEIKNKINQILKEEKK